MSEDTLQDFHQFHQDTGAAGIEQTRKQTTTKRRFGPKVGVKVKLEGFERDNLREKVNSIGL